MNKSVGITLGEIAELCAGSSIQGDPSFRIEGVASFEKAGPSDIVFITDNKYLKKLNATKAGAVILDQSNLGHYSGNAIITDKPQLCFISVADFFIESKQISKSGIHPTAVIDSSAEISDSAWIGEHTVIAANVKIHDKAQIGPNCYLETDVEVGRQTKLYANIVIRYGCRIGDNSTIHPGVVIGADGFGFALKGSERVKAPQIGYVVIGNNVEIGTNTTIDRGALNDTIIGDGVKVDNLVQIAHNVQVGDDTVITAQCGVAGSATIGKRCILGGQAAINGHISICDDVVIAARSQVMRSISKPGLYSSGLKADEFKNWKKNIARLYHLDDYTRRLIKLEKIINQLPAE